MAIISLTDVKLRGRIASSEFDEELTMLIGACQKVAEAYCNRSFDLGQQTEYHDIEPGQSALWVKVYPITTVTSVLDDAQVSARAISVASDVRDEAEYYARGQVQLWNNEGSLTPGQAAARVGYTGGYSAATCPDDLTLALCDFVLFEFNQRERIGMGEGGDGQAAAYRQTGRIPDEVRAALAPYRNPGRWLG